MCSSLAATRGWPFTAWIVSTPRHQPCSRRVEGSMSPCGGSPAGPNLAMQTPNATDEIDMHCAVTSRSRFYWRSAAATLTSLSALAALVVVLLMPAIPDAAAADAVFPAGSRVGLVPPAGMVPSRTFLGFQQPGTNAAIVLTVLPANAYDQLAKSMVPQAMKKEGIEVERR